MSGNSIVADTSLIVNLFNGVELAKNAMQDRHIWLSCITEIELLSFQDLTREEEALIRSFLNESNVIDLIMPIREITINLRKNLRLKVPDAIIAATSIYLDIPLITMDKDVRNIDQLNSVILEL